MTPIFLEIAAYILLLIIIIACKEKIIEVAIVLFVIISVINLIAFIWGVL